MTAPGAGQSAANKHQADTLQARGPLAAWLLGWIAGTAVHLQAAALPSMRLCLAWLAAGGLLACAAHALAARSRWAWLPAVVAAAALAFGLCGVRAGLFQQQALDPALEGVDLQLEGVVDAMPQRGPNGVRLRFAVEAAAWQDQPVRVPPRISLGWWVQEGDAAPPPLVAGERWRLTARLKAPHGNLNPHGYDAELWMWEQGLQASGSVRTTGRDTAPERLATGGWRPVERARQSVRDAILARVADARSAGVVAALVTGDQNAIARGDWDVFRATGVAHLMSISGLHVTMFAWLASALASWLWRRSGRWCLALPAPTASLLIGVTAAAAYALFSGWGVPSQRTVWMLATLALLRMTACRWPWPLVWLLACAVVLAADPWALLQAGFWLSFVAVGVLFAADGGTAPAHTGPAPGLARHASRAWRSLAGLLREQGIVTLALAPLTLLLFQQVSLVGLLANLLAIPCVTLVVTPLAMLGMLLPPLWQLAALAVDGLGALLGFMAQWPLATLSRPAAPWWMGMAGVAGGVLLVMRLPAHLRLMGLPVVLPVLLWQPLRPADGRFDLLAADVGQGNAVLVRTAHHSLLYDAGPRYSAEVDAGERVLVPLLRALGERPDLLVLSHRDSDHTGGAQALLHAHPQAGLLASLEPGHALWAERPSGRPCLAGETWTWDDVRFEVLHPATVAQAGARPNTQSCVLRVVAASGAAALLAGDIERAQEATLVAQGADLRADVLLTPHHGSNTSSSAPFLAAVAPRLAIVQAGYRNRFGHPAPAALARHAAQGVPVVASPACGALQWSSEAPGAWTCTRDLRRRYWHHVPPP